MVQQISFKILRWIADRWVNRNCRVLFFGEENIANNKDEKRVYVTNHPTTFDVPVMLSINMRNIFTMIDANAYTLPFIGWLLRGAGFIKFVKGRGLRALERARAYIEAKKPFLQTLRTGEAIIGEKSRPRIGGILLAHKAQANLYPIYVMVEEGKRVLKHFRGLDLKRHPYSNLNKALYFVRFGKPIRYEDYAKDYMTPRDLHGVANRISDYFKKEREAMMKLLSEKKEYFARLSRRGGPEHRILF